MTDWRNELSPPAITEDMQRGGVKLKFLHDMPEVVNSVKYNSTFYKWQVLVAEKKMTLNASLTLARKIAEFPRIEGKTFQLMRTGRDFETDYVFQPVD